MFQFKWRLTPVATASDEILESSVHSESTEEVINLNGDKLEDVSAVSSLNLSYLDLWALALTTSIGGHYLTWCSGLSAGFGTFMIATILIASGFVCLLCCLAELSSAIPFAGGAYGIARVTLGIYPGYLVACADTFKSVLYVASAASNVGVMITLASGGKRQYEPAYWFVFYALSIAVHACGGRMQWRVITALTVTSVVLLAVYLLGSAKFANLLEHAALEDDTNTPYEQWFHGGFYEFMHVLPRPCLFFVGVQNINLACREIQNPKTEVPKAYMGGLCTGLLTSFSTVLVACSLLPGVTTLAQRIHPLTRGYMLIFGVTRAKAMILSLPATIASGFGFMYFFGQQLRSMGQSRLLNPVFARELPGRATPIVALVVGSVLGYALCLIVYFKPGLSIYLYNIATMGAFTTYLSIFLSFWRFRDCFSTIKREFVSPLGKAGAAYGFAVFAFAFIAICAFQKTQIAVSTFSGMVVVATAYYYVVVEKRQVFSEEEKTVMFKAYLVKGNASKASRIKKSRGGSTGRRSNATTPTPKSGTGSKRAPGTPASKATNTVETAIALTAAAPAGGLSLLEQQPPGMPRAEEEDEVGGDAEGGGNDAPVPVEVGEHGMGVWEKEEEGAGVEMQQSLPV